MVEMRNSPRHRVRKAGRIDLGGGAIDCTVLNLSGTGAALEVTGQAGIPERFVLVLDTDKQHLPCRVVWRQGYRIGVLFEQDRSAADAVRPDQTA